MSVEAEDSQQKSLLVSVSSEVEGPSREGCAEGTDFRVKFLSQLSYRGLLVPQARRQPKHRTLIIFDWDDTLLCTSFMRSGQYFAAPWLFRAIGSAARQVLELSRQLGETVIITNAAAGWVEQSTEEYLPEVGDALQDVRVISACHKYSEQYKDVSEWKKRTFDDVWRELGPDSITNLVSIGDSVFERDAAHAVRQAAAGTVVKTVKLRDQPTPQELILQLDLVARELQRLVRGGSDRDEAVEWPPGPARLTRPPSKRRAACAQWAPPGEPRLSAV